MEWIEVGDGCFAGRYEPFDVGVGVVIGDDGLLVVDTRASTRQGRTLRDDIRRLSTLPVRAVVDTHWHFDHCFGNGAFEGVPVYGHASVPRTLADRAEKTRAGLADEPGGEEYAETEVVPPDTTFQTVRSVVLGDRVVELVHPGRGHTDGDIVVLVPDADVLYAGDLIEESGPPAYGDDSYPLDWPATLEILSGLLTPRTAVVPGHGKVVDQMYVLSQRGDLSRVAATVQRLWSEGVREEAVLDSGTWPFPVESLRV
ncbi:MAG TPA: MBL fold metallo-hydrolase, partial [Actinopolymorphaceae bacterium]